MKKMSFSFYSICIIVASFVIQYFHVALAIDGTNVLIVALEKEYGWTRLAINSTISMGALLSILGVIGFGTLIMKTSNKKIMVPAAVLIGLNLIWLAMAKNISTFEIAMITLQVLLVGPMITSLALLSSWFIKRRGLVLGIVTIGAPASSATFTPITTKLIDIYGFGTVYTAIGIIYLFFSLLIMFFVFEKPEDFGYAPDNADISPEKIAKAKEELDSYVTTWTFARVMKTKEVWLLIFSWGLIFFMMTGIMSQLIPRFLDVGIPLDQALGLMSLAAIAGMPMSYVWGWLDDKFGTPKTCILFSFAYVFGSICFIFGSAENMIFAFGGILAVALTTGGMPNLQPSLQAWVFGRKDFINTNRYINVGHMILRSFGFTVMGIIYSRYGTYTPAYYIFIGVAIVTAILFSMIKTTYDPERIALMK
ncbi:MAG: MFS transporter [Desulfobacteraceae bacterium]|nr:MFS transporter [Desulfobacteraceae bacterium]